MRLQLNPDKTTLLVFSRPNQSHWKSETKIIDGEEIINPVPQIKLLGFYINERLSQDTNISLTIGVINSILNNIKPIEGYLTPETRTRVCSAFMLSRINYGLPQYLGETNNNLYRIHAITMRLVRWSKQSFCFKVSIQDMCHSLKWDTPRQIKGQLKS